MALSYAFFCNQDVFNELQIESLPKTWKQVRDLSKKMVTFDRNGFLNRVGYLPNYGNLRTSNVIAWQLGQKFIDKEDNVNFSSSELQRSFSWVKNFIDEIGLDNVLQLMGTFGVGDQHGFISGKVAMMILDSSFPEVISRYNPKLNYKVIPIPSFEGSETVSSSGTWWVGIPKGAKNPRKAWEFIKFISDKENFPEISEIAVGSWIDCTLSTWSGEEDESLAWKRLVEARKALVEFESANPTHSGLETAWESLYIAEGSDWFWWYGLF